MLKGMLGMPQADSSFPFALLISVGDKIFLLTGLAGGHQQHQQAELLVLSAEKAREIEIKLSETLCSLPLDRLHDFLLRGLQGNYPEGFVELQSFLPDPVSSILPSLDMEIARCVRPLMDPERGVFLQLPDKDLQEGVAGLYMAFKNPEAVQRTIIDAVVETTANMLMSGRDRDHWQLALEVVAAIADSKGDDVVSKVALHNAAAIKQDITGAQIPFVHSWINQQLASAVALARMVEKAKQFPEQ